tara:strand:+ start:257 stop:433 length:177 start_codon:yes stop_codon:yes gene_type:complete
MIRLITNIFSADLACLISIEDESKLIVTVAKELEFQRDKTIDSLQLLKDFKKIKLNKS